MRRAAGLLVVTAIVGMGCGGKEAAAVSTGTPPPAPDAGVTTPVAPSGPTVLASGVQPIPTNIVSDGASLFWSGPPEANGPQSAIVQMPVMGGDRTDFAMGLGTVLAVDDANLYYVGSVYENAGLFGVIGAPKGGAGAPWAISEAPTSYLQAATVLGSRAYWVEGQFSGYDGLPYTAAAESAPLQGGTIATLAAFDGAAPVGGAVGVTSTTFFVSGTGAPLASFALGASVPTGASIPLVPGAAPTCRILVSDSDAVYCDTGVALDRVASDGTITQIATLTEDPNAPGVGVAVDDAYVYWVNDAPDGTIMRAPKSGGSATVLAHDASPVAIAVDRGPAYYPPAVYWSDQGGNIMRLLK